MKNEKRLACNTAPRSSELKPSVKLQASEVIDATRLSAADLREYIEAELASAKADNLMVLLHLKATMMKISDPIIFGHVVSVFFKDAFEKHADTFAALGVNPNNGLGALFGKLKGHAKEEHVNAGWLTAQQRDWNYAADALATAGAEAHAIADGDIRDIQQRSFQAQIAHRMMLHI